jgi:riboflavin kinase/FMN adenylyltransferase
VSGAAAALAPAIAIGKFDALHRGHRALAAAAAALGAPALLAFTGMAEELGWPVRPPLVAASDRARILDAWGKELGWRVRLLELPFAEVRPLAPADFLALLRRRFSAGAVVVGEDFRFGRGRAAGAAELPALAAELAMRSVVVPPVLDAGEAISSSRVRAALAAGECETVTRLLGRPHRLIGTVRRGDGRGRQLGFPTANCGDLQNQPMAAGVYAAHAWIAGDGPWPAAVNAGHLPTVGGERAFSVEAHLLGFRRDCYGQRLELEPLARLREETRFPSLDALKTQIAADVAEVERRLGG